jgi:putative acetyltransferase
MRQRQLIAIERVTSLTPDVATLLEALDLYLGELYTAEQQHGLSPEALFQPHLRFFLARLDGAAVGCGGVAVLGGFAEVKRLYTDDTARGRGVAAALLSRIEAEARAADLPLLRLETGIHQGAAIAFFERMGFEARGPFGEYADMPARHIATSLFYEKALWGRRSARAAA